MTTAPLSPDELRALRNRSRPGGVPVQSSVRQEHEGLCAACPRKATDCPVWKALSPCNRRKALAGDPAYPCPEGRF